jgi:uncharacterized phage protein (TIGR01671 family)
MKREIKFKFWCKGTSDNLNFNKPGWWTYPNFLLNKYYAHLDIFDSEDFVACQYTGLKDKNGKEIYEGDIISHGKFFPNCEVFYDESSGSFKHKIYGAGTLAGQVLTISNFKKRSLKKFEVIGNIFENPELLD